MMASSTLVASVGSVDDLFRLLESNDSAVWHELRHLVYEQYSEVKESWLVCGLYDAFAQSGSPRCLDLLLNVRGEAHEKFLCDKMADGLRQGGKARAKALQVLGFVVRKQPSWLYKMTQHSLMKELIKVLKHEDDIIVMMSALLDLLVLMPILPVYVAPYLQDLFEVFSRVSSWRYQSIKGLPEVQQVHVQVGLYAFFHRLYGMFPCNFLCYLRSQYSDSNKDNQAVFVHTIRPMLNTVRMHPMLVTQSRDYEKTSARWKRMELHDIIVESSRYSLVAQESAKEDEEPAAALMSMELDVGSYTSFKSQSEHSDFQALYAANSQDPLWTPSRKCEMSSGGGGLPTTADSVIGPSPGGSTLSRLTLDSPPEAAIEATPETTPFVTPVKEESFRFARPQPSSGVSRQLRLEIGSLRSPALGGTAGSSVSSSTGFMTAPTGKGNNVLSPTKEPSPFRFPDLPHRMQGSERRDSIFERGAVDLLGSRLSKMVVGSNSSNSADVTLTSSASTLTPAATTTMNTGGGNNANFSSVAVSSSALLAKGAAKPGASTPQQFSDNKRPSPVKFTSQRPDQFPIRPEPERPPPPAVTEALKHKMLSLENLKESLPDFGKEEQDDDEITKITGGNDDPGNHLSTRHITPQIVDSGATSRTVSRLSTSSQADDRSRPVTSTAEISSAPPTVGGPSATTKVSASPAVTVTTTSDSRDCRAGGLHPPSKTSVKDFVRLARGRIKYLSVCGVGSGGMPADIAAEVASAMTSGQTVASPTSFVKDKLKKTSSCPDVHQLRDYVAAKAKKGMDQLSVGTSGGRISSGLSPNHAAVVEEEGEETEEQLKDKHIAVQTEEYLVSPYEHLFPSVLPQWFGETGAANKENGHADNKSSAAELEQNANGSSNNPYDVLDQYVKAAYETFETGQGKPDNEAKVLREEIALLHNQLLYERHRRETLGLRNRRLLGKTKSSRILEEQNTALRDQLRIAESEITILFDQLESLRREKHEVEAERAQHERQRDEEIERLISENIQLKQARRELEEKTAKQAEEIQSASIEMSRLEASLFNTKSEVDRLEKKEDARRLSEKELIELRKEVLLQGELVRKYREKLILPLASPREHESHYREAYKHQVETMRMEMRARGSEIEALKAKVNDLDQTVLKKEHTVAEQKRLLQKISHENEEQVKEIESAYTTLMDCNVQLEGRIMELQDQLSRANRSRRRSSRPAVSTPTPAIGATCGASVGGRSSDSSSLSSATNAIPARPSGIQSSANVDIEMPPEVLAGTGGIVDKTFMVGSPPSSSGGSLGSDQSEVIRRALEGGPVNLGRIVGGVDDMLPEESSSGRSPEIGSAVSANETLGTSADSVNGGRGNGGGKI